MRNRFRVTVAILLVAAAAVFAVGVAVVERSQSDDHSKSASQENSNGGANAPEGSVEREQAERGESSEAAEPGGETTEELFGVNTESTGLVVAAVAFFVLLALAAVTVRSPGILALVIFVALAATVFDVREVIHQVDESRGEVAVLAALTAGLHALASIVAAVGLVTERTGGHAPGGVAPATNA